MQCHAVGVTVDLKRCEAVDVSAVLAELRSHAGSSLSHAASDLWRARGGR